MIDEQHEALRDLLAGYLAGVLDDEEAAAFDDHLDGCDACAAELRRLTATGDALLAAGVDLDAVRDRALAVIAADGTPAVALLPRVRRRPGRLLGVAAAAVATVAAACAAAFVIGRSTAPVPALRDARTLATLAPLEASGAHGDAHVARSGTATVIRLHLSGLRRLPSGEYYELWLGNADGRMIGLASFAARPDGSADVTVPLPVTTGAFAFVDVSLEPADGDPAHSAESIARGPISRS